MTGSMVLPNPDCPNSAAHELRPKGYLAHSAWADEMAETHEQQQCPECSLWVIWVPKQPDAAPTVGAAHEPKETNE
jgi:hypothetical protein